MIMNCLRKFITQLLDEAWNPVSGRFDTVTHGKETEDALQASEKRIKRGATHSEYNGIVNNQFESDVLQMMSEPEYKTIDAFVQYKFDDEQDTFTATELQALARNIDYKTRKLKGALPPQGLVTSIKQELESYGLKLQQRETTKHFRGSMSNAHGSNPFAGMGGGSGFTEVPSRLHSKKQGFIYDPNDPRSLRMSKRR